MSDELPAGVFSVPLRWHVPEETPTYYATNMVLQFTKREFVVSFFQAFPPLLTGTAEEVEQQMSEMDALTARCVARIVIAPDRMPAFVEAFQGNLEQFQARHGSAEEL